MLDGRGYILRASRLDGSCGLHSFNVEGPRVRGFGGGGGRRKLSRRGGLAAVIVVIDGPKPTSPPKP